MDEAIAAFVVTVTFVSLVNFATAGIIANNENNPNCRSVELSTELTKITGITKLAYYVLTIFSNIPTPTI